MRTLLSTLLALLAVAFTSHVQAQETARPNVVFMLAENMGYGDLGCIWRRSSSMALVAHTKISTILRSSALSSIQERNIM